MDGALGQIIILVIFVIIGLIRKAAQDAQKEPEVRPDDDHQDDDWDDLLGDIFADDQDDAAEGSPWPEEPARPEPVVVVDPFEAERQALIGKLDALSNDAEILARSARVERKTKRISQVIDDFVLPRARALRTEAGDGRGRIPGHIDRGLEDLGLVFAATEALIRQRRLPGLSTALGDADELARACYDPILDFARMNRLEVTSADPACLLTPFDLGIWTGFIPTGIAPIFLPRNFFADLRWWPALAHEIGHDFLAATTHAEARLRRELELPSEAVGTQPLAPRSQAMVFTELVRVFGGWFEEIFCDIFGTMMMGPAYGYTMVDIFAAPHAPHQTETVAVAAGGRRYKRHPPRLLRVLLCAKVLELMGEEEAAAEIVGEWRAAHGDQPEIIFPVVGGGLAIPVELVASIAAELAQRLHRDGMEGLDGHSLSDIPGLSYGPHRAAEARRVRDELLAGRAPAQHPTRAVIAGAVMAWHRAKDRHDEILALARHAVVGVTETHEDAYTRAAKAAPALARPGSPGELREAFLLHTILSPPPALRRYRPRSGGFAARRQWPPRA